MAAEKAVTHTPGPWQTSGVRISGASLSKERLLQIVAPSGAVAFVIYSDRTPADHVQAHADQRLIAAAPVLLAELKSTTLLLRTALLCTSVEIARQARPFLDAADAAIARAEGRRRKTLGDAVREARGGDAPPPPMKGYA